MVGKVPAKAHEGPRFGADSYSQRKCGLRRAHARAEEKGERVGAAERNCSVLTVTTCPGPCTAMLSVTCGRGNGRGQE